MANDVEHVEQPFHLTDQRGEPLVTIAPYGAGLGFAFERTVHDSSQISKLRKAERRALESPNLCMRLGESETVALPSLPAWSASYPLEATLPGFVELDQQLGANVTRHVREPGQLGPKLGKLVDLIDPSWEDARCTRQKSFRCSRARFQRNLSADSQASSRAAAGSAWHSDRSENGTPCGPARTRA